MEEKIKRYKYTPPVEKRRSEKEYKITRAKTHAIHIGTGLLLGAVLVGYTKTATLNKTKEEETNEKKKKTKKERKD